MLFTVHQKTIESSSFCCKEASLKQPHYAKILVKTSGKNGSKDVSPQNISDTDENGRNREQGDSSWDEVLTT